MLFDQNNRGFPKSMNYCACATAKHANRQRGLILSTLCFRNQNITILDGGQGKVITFGSRVPRSFHGGPVAAAFFGAAERPPCRRGEASATALGRGGCHRSRGHAAKPPTAAGRRRAGRNGDPPDRRTRVWEGEGQGEEGAGVEMSRSMGRGQRRLDEPSPQTRMARGGEVEPWQSARMVGWIG
jgi:hypothetical protein